MSEVPGREIEIVFIIPCRNRGEKLEAAINAIAATVNTTFHVLVGFDDDATSHAQMHQRPYVTKLLYSPRHYFVRTMNRLWQDARALFPNMTYFVICNDDDVFSLFGWGPKAIATHKEFWPDNRGILELFWGGRIHCYLSHVDTFKDEPWIYEPAYTQYFSDHELLEKMKKEKRYAAIDEMDVLNRVVQHNVMSTLDSLASETHKTWSALDAKVYIHRNPEQKLEDV